MNLFTSTSSLGITLIVLAILTIILAVMVISLHLKLKKFLVGINSKNLDDSLTHVSGNLKDLQSFQAEMEKYLASVEKRLQKSTQSIHTVRFNPFKGTGGGGNQSFATTFINKEGDGVVISSLYSRDHVSVFAKPIIKYKSEYELSEEELRSIDNAKKGLND